MKKYNRILKDLLKNKVELVKSALTVIIILIVIIILLIIPIIINPILDNTINKVLKNYVVEYDSNLYSSIITAIIACVTAFLGYKYAFDQFFSTNRARLIVSAPILYYYNCEVNGYRFCTHEKLELNDDSSSDNFAYFEDCYNSRDFEITINNIGKGICENFKVIIDFKKWSYFNQIVEAITDNTEEYTEHFANDHLKKELMYIEQEKKTPIYFANGIKDINTSIAYLCIIDEDNHTQNIKNVERRNYFIKKWHKIADIKISYDDVFTGRSYIMEYDFEIYLIKRPKIYPNVIEPNYHIFTNIKQTEITEKKRNIFSSL